MFTGGDFTSKSDVYSIGIMLNELATRYGGLYLYLFSFCLNFVVVVVVEWFLANTSFHIQNETFQIFQVIVMILFLIL
jgi:hypothetical protein